MHGQGAGAGVLEAHGGRQRVAEAAPHAVRELGEQQAVESELRQAGVRVHRVVGIGAQGPDLVGDDRLDAA